MGEWPINWPGDGLKVIPVRNPYDAWLSSTVSANHFIGLWHELISTRGFFFPIETENRDLMVRAIEFIGEEPDLEKILSYPWKPVNMSARDRSLECSEEMKERLKFAYDWYLCQT